MNSLKKINNKIKEHLSSQLNSYKKFLDLPTRKLKLKERHQLRVLTRRLQAVLKLIESVISPKKYKKVLSNLKRLENGLGALRKLDVAKKDARENKMNTRILIPLRKAAEKEVKSSISYRHRKKVFKGMSQIKGCLDDSPLFHVNKPILKLRDKITLWSKQKELSKKELHRLRILIKKTRYTLEVLNLPCHKLKLFQDDLGRIHDFETLGRIFANHKQTNMKTRKLQKKVNRVKDEVLKFALSQLSHGPILNS